MPVLFYFAESPFFDPTSNNASLAIQANYNEAFRHFVETREAFEARLKTMQGLEFIVAYDPLQAAAQSDTRFAHEPSNIWVIRKQNRRKRNGMEDEVTVISTYFVVGDCIYMAPSVASVVGNRIVSFPLIAGISQSANDLSYAAIGRYIPVSTDENRIDSALLYTVLRTHIHATDGPRNRVRSTGIPTKQRKYPHARRSTSHHRRHTNIQQSRTRHLQHYHKLQLPGYPKLRRSIQPVHAVRGRIHGRESTCGRARLIHHVTRWRE